MKQSTFYNKNISAPRTIAIKFLSVKTIHIKTITTIDSTIDYHYWQYTKKFKSPKY